MYEASTEEGKMLLDPETKLHHGGRLSFPHIGEWRHNGATRQAEEDDP